jgi:hypothetical protein
MATSFEKRAVYFYFMPLVILTIAFAGYIWPEKILANLIQSYRHSQTTGLPDLCRPKYYLLEGVPKGWNGTLLPFLVKVGNSSIGTFT